MSNSNQRSSDAFDANRRAANNVADWVSLVRYMEAALRDFEALTNHDDSMQDLEILIQNEVRNGSIQASDLNPTPSDDGQNPAVIGGANALMPNKSEISSQNVDESDRPQNNHLTYEELDEDLDRCCCSTCLAMEDSDEEMEDISCIASNQPDTSGWPEMHIDDRIQWYFQRPNRSYDVTQGQPEAEEID